MTREYPPCSSCAKFVPAKAGTGCCTDFDRPANAEDQPCVLFLHRGTRSARMAARSSQELLAEMQRRETRKTETNSRASASKHETAR